MEKIKSIAGIILLDLDLRFTTENESLKIFFFFSCRIDETPRLSFLEDFGARQQAFAALHSEWFAFKNWPSSYRVCSPYILTFDASHHFINDAMKSPWGLLEGI